MPRPAEIVEKIDNRDHAPASQSADLSTVSVHPASHWQHQADDRAASAPSQSAPRPSSEPTPGDSEAQLTPDPGTEPQPEPEAYPSGRGEPAASQTPEAGSSEQQTAQAGGSNQADGRIELGGELEWRDLEGGTHSRDFEIGLDYDTRTEVLGEFAGTQSWSGGDGALGEVADLTGGLGDPLALDGLASSLTGVAGGGLATVQGAVAGVTSELDGVVDQLGGVVGDLGGLDDALDLDALAPDLLASPGEGDGLLSALFEPDGADDGLDALQGAPLDELLDLDGLTEGGPLDDLAGGDLLGGGGEGDGLLGLGSDPVDDLGGTFGL